MNQSALKLSIPKRDKKSAKWAEPVFTGKLAEVLGTSTAVAERIGVAPSTISLGLRENRIYSPIETAARYWYEKDYTPKVARSVVTCAVPGDKVQSLKDFVGHLGGEVGPVFTL